MSMEVAWLSDPNGATLSAYNSNVERYIENSPDAVNIGGLKDWLDRTFEDLPYDARVLEIGTGGGRDADYVEKELGYVVERTDASQGFVDRLNDRGYPAEHLNVLTDEIAGNYDVVFADAVFLHFSREQTRAATQKVYRVLNSGGRFALTLKPGEGEGWSSHKLGVPRWFCSWDNAGFEEVLAEAGFTRFETVPDENGWLQYIAHKEPES